MVRFLTWLISINAMERAMNNQGPRSTSLAQASCMAIANSLLLPNFLTLRAMVERSIWRHDPRGRNTILSQVRSPLRLRAKSINTQLGAHSRKTCEGYMAS